MGVVYKAKDLTLRRDVAIKTIRFDSMAASQTASDELRERFKREARTAAQLKHPNIVTIYDIGDAEGLSYIAMEFIDGVGLERILAESGKLSAARAAGLTAQVADALAFAHEHGVIHRDIKPANIMVEAGERVKLTDFGIAKPMDAAEDLTATGSLLGTPSYMSPEQARGQKVDGRSDLFSVGCVLYELLAGRKAFTGETITGILMKIITEEPPPIREVDPLVPDDAVHVITKILQKAPEKRYQTGRELADDLLSLTRPGHVPTVREADVPTASGGEVAPPTIVTPPTAQGTISSSPTVSQGSSTEKASVPPVPPTERVSPPPPPAQTRPAATSGRTRRPQPLPSRRPPGRGKGPALAIAAGGAVALIILALGTWWALERREPAPPSAAEVGTTAESPVPPPDAAATAGPRAAEATPPAPAAATTPVATPPPPTPSPAQAGAAGRAPSSPPRADTTVRATQPASAPQPAPPVATQAGPPTAPAGEDFLDRLPEESAPDGRAAGEALAQQFRSGSDSGSFGATGTYRRRPRIPRHAPAEKPAVYGLAWILSAQKAHLERTGRYGSLSELVQAGDLPTVEQNASGDGFTRRQYRFTIRASGDRFRADARPLAPRGRAFYVDEAGYVLVDN
jgi:serine/threonine-protein kinase